MASNTAAIGRAPPRPEVYRIATVAQAARGSIPPFGTTKSAMQYGIAPSDQLAPRSLLGVALSSVAGKGNLPLQE